MLLINPEYKHFIMKPDTAAQAPLSNNAARPNPSDHILISLPRLTLRILTTSHDNHAAGHDISEPATQAKPISRFAAGNNNSILSIKTQACESQR